MSMASLLKCARPIPDRRPSLSYSPPPALLIYSWLLTCSHLVHRFARFTENEWIGYSKGALEGTLEMNHFIRGRHGGSYFEPVFTKKWELERANALKEKFELLAKMVTQPLMPAAHRQTPLMNTERSP